MKFFHVTIDKIEPFESYLAVGRLKFFFLIHL